MAIVLPSPEIWHRDDFAVLCNWRKLWRAVEVGVDKGEFSQAFLSRWQGYSFLGVDPYLPYPGMDWPRDADFHVAVMRYERYARVAKLAKIGSVELAATLMERRTRDIWGDDLFQFIYIDGCHEFDSVMADLLAWWPLLGDDGILAGHDFDGDHPGVVRAVTQFAGERGLTVYTTPDRPASWYTYKSGIPGPGWVRNPPPPPPPGA